MKRVLLTVLVVGLLASQASASMYILDRATAKTFTQQNPVIGGLNELYLSIDNPGTLGSTINYQANGSWDQYGMPMTYDVGFVGGLGASYVMSIGVDGDLPGNDGSTMDTFAIHVANDDNNDNWGVRLYLVGVSYTVPSFTTLTPGAATMLSLTFTPGTVTEFGFEVDYPATSGSDQFHISVVPVPAALILGLLGMGAAGLKLRRFA